MHSTVFFTTLIAALPSALCALYEHPSQLPTHSFDFVIVGGGTAGNVIANRLTENSDVTVLVLEAGGSNEGVLASAIPLFAPTLARTAYDWNYTTTPQPGFNGREIIYPRGFILGGSSAINYLVYNRGSRDDFEAYAKIAGDSRWSWDTMYNHWARKNEEFVAPNDHHNISGQYLPSAHSTSGILDISLPGYPWPIDEHVMAVTKEFPDEFPYQVDVNAGKPIGISWAQSTIGDGQRSSSATSYLAEKYINRPNLSVLLHARATKVVRTSIFRGVPRFGAVDFVAIGSTLNRKDHPHGAPDRTLRVHARKEVILSAGSFNTPQLLMLSGVGNKTELDEFGIKTIVDLPDVGKNGSDHILFANVIYVNATDTFEKHTASTVIGEEIAQWSQTHKGPLSYGLTNNMGWLRLPPSDPVLEKYGDPSSGPTSPHYELLFCAGFAAPGLTPPNTGLFNTIFSALISPTSRGTVSLRSSDPLDAPIINPNYIATETDLHILVESHYATRKIVESKSWEGYFKGFWGDLAQVKTKAELEQFIRNTTGTVHHFVGTAAMSPRGAKYGVLDPDLRVKGTVGLRVVDASVFPFVPSAHTQGPIYLIAEMASDMIKEKYDTPC